MFSRTFMTRFWFIVLGAMFLWMSTMYSVIPERGALYEYTGQFERILDRTGRDSSGFIFTLKGIEPAFHYVRNAGNNREIIHRVQTTRGAVTVLAEASRKSTEDSSRDIMEVFEIDVHGHVKQDYDTIVGNHQLNKKVTFVIGLFFLLSAAYLIVKKVEIED